MADAAPLPILPESPCGCGTVAQPLRACERERYCWKEKFASSPQILRKRRKVENRLREILGYPKVGQQGITETILLKIVRRLLPDYKVIHHYRGAELEGLELDIWLPDLRVGIEYQGEQHYRVVEPWGGKAGLERRIANDKRKRKLCRSLGYDLIEIKFSEKLSDQLVRSKLSQALKKKSVSIT